MSEPYWVPMGAAPLTPVVYPGTELAYAEITAGVNATATTEATANTVITAPDTVFDGTPVIIEFYAPYVQPPAGTTLSLYLTLYDGGTSIGHIAFVATPTGSLYVPVLVRRKLTPSAGAHIYSIRCWGSTGTKAVGAGPGGGTQYPPAHIRITKV